MTSNTKNYRDVAFHPSDIRDFSFISREQLVDILEICLFANTHGSRDAYNAFIARWKDAYNELSNFIVETRKDRYLHESERQQLLQALRKLANTLLNARQYAWDTYMGKANKGKAATNVVSFRSR